MSESRWERYEAKRRELKQQYRQKKRKIHVIMWSIVVVALALAITVGVVSTDVRAQMTAYIVGVVAAAGALIFGGRRIGFYVEQENTQLNLLEQDEPFNRFHC